MASVIQQARTQAKMLKRADTQPGWMLPLDYLLTVVNDPTVPAERRDRIAIAAAPYCHPRLTEPVKIGKKDRQDEAAESAGMGTPWAADLEFENRAQ